MNRLSGYLASVSLALALSCTPAAAKFITFQPPGATTTTVSVVTNSGEIIGNFIDQSGTAHGFIRAADGTFTTIDVPGAIGTYPAAINGDGTIVGTYSAERPVKRLAFIRTPDGQITTFEAPHADRFTNAVSIDNKGWIAGWGYNGAHPNKSFSFLRNPSGHFTRFGQQSLAVQCANSALTTAGQLFDQSGGPHGFVRTRDGTVTKFDPAGAAYTYVEAINNSDTTAGFSITPEAIYEGFVRAADGTISTFLGDQDAINTYAWGINKLGTIVGSYDNSDGSGGGYVRAPDGTITTFEVQGSPGTQPISINDKGQIAGQVRLNGVQVGFIGKP